MRLHILSSYDEFIRYSTLPTSLSITKADADRILVVNNSSLNKFVTSDEFTQVPSDRIFEIPLYRRDHIFPPYRYKAMRSYLTSEVENLVRHFDAKEFEIVVYTAFMNGATALILKKLRSHPKIDILSVTLIPSLPHILPRRLTTGFPMEYLKQVRDTYLYGASTDRVDIGHLSIPAIKMTAFDRIVFLPPLNRADVIPVTEVIENNVPQDDQPTVIFLTQPLTKNSRTTLSAVVNFFNELKRNLDLLGCKLILKLHPGESAKDYSWLGVELLPDYIPFQSLKFSEPIALLTFSSGAVMGSEKPVISCSRLIKFLNETDRDAIEALFDRRLAEEYLAACRRPLNWEALKNEVSQLIHS